MEYIDDLGLCSGLDCMSNADLDAARLECQSLISTGSTFAADNARGTLRKIDAECMRRADFQAALAPISARLDASMHHYWRSIGLE